MLVNCIDEKLTYLRILLEHLSIHCFLFFGMFQAGLLDLGQLVHDALVIRAETVGLVEVTDGVLEIPPAKMALTTTKQSLGIFLVNLQNEVALLLCFFPLFLSDHGGGNVQAARDLHFSDFSLLVIFCSAHVVPQMFDVTYGFSVLSNRFLVVARLEEAVASILDFLDDVKHFGEVRLGKPVDPLEVVGMVRVLFTRAIIFGFEAKISTFFELTAILKQK